MPHTNNALHLRLSKKKQKTLIDNAAMAASFVYPLSGVPQVITVFSGSVEGVSLLSWSGFAVFTFLFMNYGIIHKIKPMIITNLLWFLIDLMVVIGILIHS